MTFPARRYSTASGLDRYLHSLSQARANAERLSFEAAARGDQSESFGSEIACTFLQLSASESGIDLPLDLLMHLGGPSAAVEILRALNEPAPASQSSPDL